jgi:ATP-dependent Lon protease
MRDFRDAKAMAQTLRDSLSAKVLKDKALKDKTVTISHSESLELVSKMFGAADWNTLSALIQAGRRAPTAAAAPQAEPARTYPAMPIRDLVPFPSATFPLFVGRPKTIQALDHAFERQREVVLVVQKDSALDEPGFDDICEIGVLAGILDLLPFPDVTLKVMVQVHRRVAIRRFFGETGAYFADIADISEGRIPAAPELVEDAIARFKTYAKARNISAPPLLDHIRDPGRIADIISTHVALPLKDKQDLLTTLDPVARLERVHALMETG